MTLRGPMLERHDGPKCAIVRHQGPHAMLHTRGPSAKGIRRCAQRMASPHRRAATSLLCVPHPKESGPGKRRGGENLGADSDFGFPEIPGPPAENERSRAWESVRGSVTMRRHGSMNFVVIWFVSVPGIHLPPVPIPSAKRRPSDARATSRGAIREAHTAPSGPSVREPRDSRKM